MIVKKYEAPTMQKALQAVKKDLGQDAVILHTKTRKKDGLLGLWGKEMVEITASRDINLMDRGRQNNTGKLIKYYKKTLESENASSPSSNTKSDVTMLHSDINEVKSLVHSLLKRSQHADVSSLTDELLEAYIILIEQEVSEELSKGLICRIRNELANDEVKNHQAIQRALMNAIKQMIPNVDPISLPDTGGARKVALVGPTGVGKTTTIAKLAADFTLRKGKDVALITVDTYRIAAVEQLRTYADIIDIPLEVILTPGEIKKAIEKHMHRDLILIDTAGRSQKNALQISELKNFIESISPDETHLVLSTTANYKNIANVVERFDSLAIDKIIFTKLDEAISFGLILNVLSRLNKTLSYVTTGQNVPDDISVTDADMLANLIVKREV